MNMRSMYKIGMLLFVFNTIISATNVNGRFVVISTDSLILEVLLQVNTNTGSDDMGGATIVIGFNSSALSFNCSPQVNTHYVFHNFSGDKYSPATITKPAIDKLWLNIDLPFNNSNNGTVVSGSNGWTDVATLFFDIINPSDTLKLDWLMINPYWGIYDANNTTLWNPGTSQNLNYVITNDITPPQLVSATFSDVTTLVLNFSEQLNISTAQNINNYSISNGINVSSATLSLTQVTLRTSPSESGTYTVTVNNITDLAGNIIDPNHNSASNYLLPVELNSFTVKAKNGQVILNWRTETEVNNYGFEVERCALSAECQVWEKIGFINGNGNSNSVKEYSFTDKNPKGGSKYQYRLKQIDNDGHFEYSEIVEVEVVPVKFELSQNYPNPFNPSTKISWQCPVDSRQVLIVYDMLGNEIITLVDEYKPAGNYEVDFQSSVDSQQLASGIYIYKLSAENFTETKKMVLLR
ncbi:MAG: T9SS type A sorting domain-containing protein [Ignavibacterium sp.]|nr:T9SS type A sorting domain-containing protein [Ignavibacterium sp.]